MRGKVASVGVGLGLLAVAGLSFGSLEPDRAAAGRELVIPRPDLGALEDGPREKIEMMQNALEQTLATADRESPELREGFGFLGQLFHAFEKLGAAEICYQNARSLAPEDPRWPYYLGMVWHSRGELERAVEGYRQATELASDLIGPSIRLGNVLLDLGRGSEAYSRFERVLQLGADNAAAHFGLGRAASLAGDHEQAVKHFTKALELQPEASEVHYPLALAYRALGDLEKAKHHLQQRGEQKVSWQDPLANVISMIGKTSALEVIADLAAEEGEFSEADFLGFVMSQFGKMPGAAEQLEKILRALEAREGESTPRQRARIEYAIGGLLVSQDRDLEAIPHFQQAVRGDPSLQDAYVKLGNAQARNGQFEQAVADFSRALELRPDDPVVLLKRATALVNLGRHEQALADLERATGRDPGNLEAWTALAEVRERAGDMDGAASALQKAIEAASAPEDKTAHHVDLGDLYRRQRIYDRSAQEYLRALAIDEGHVPALSRLAALLGQLGEYRGAAEVYARWIAREPESVRARMGQATALILGGEHRAARERLEEALAAAPTSLDIKDLLTRHLAACPDPSVRDGQRALELALELYREVPTLESVETLAMAYAEAGRFEEAVLWQQRLLEGGSDEMDEERRARWRANLSLYQDGRPCCAAP